MSADKREAFELGELGLRVIGPRVRVLFRKLGADSKTTPFVEVTYQGKFEEGHIISFLVDNPKFSKGLMQVSNGYIVQPGELFWDVSRALSGSKLRDYVLGQREKDVLGRR